MEHSLLVSEKWTFANCSFIDMLKECSDFDLISTNAALKDQNQLHLSL
jgi:hypothetical protein